MSLTKEKELLFAWAKSNTIKTMPNQQSEDNVTYYIDASPKAIMKYDFESISDIDTMFSDCWNIPCDSKIKTLLAVSVIRNAPYEQQTHEITKDSASEMHIPDFIYMF